MAENARNQAGQLLQSDAWCVNYIIALTMSTCCAVFIASPDHEFPD
jgi:hypothetical protein